MKKPLLLAIILLTTCFTRAQYVTIPDSAFAAFLRTNYPTCMTGDQLDTTCNTVINVHGLYCYAVPIHNLSGVEYFKSLDSLVCSNDSIQVIPILPNTLKVFDCNYNNLTSLPGLPNNLKELHCSVNQLTNLPALPNSLTLLNCWRNQLNTLPALPDSLTVLNCAQNQLTNLPVLPISIQALDCSVNHLNNLPALPNSLIDLFCYGSQLTSLPALPNSLTYFDCNHNQLTNIPTLPNSIYYLECSYNQLTTLPVLPNSLASLDCSANQLTNLPTLPNLLRSLSCYFNQLTNLPTLPNSITYLDCNANQLSNLPALPNSLAELDCSNNQLTTLPALPDSLGYLYCFSNLNLTCLPQLKVINNLSFGSTNVTCLPNYGRVVNSTPPLNSLSLCGIFNPNGCNVFWNISGKTYYDQNSNCVYDSNDVRQPNVKMLLDSAGTIVQQVYTGGEGYYSFDVNYGTYTTRVDTSFLPFKVNCPAAGYRTSVISAADSLDYSYDFGLNCRSTGFDLGVSSVLNNYTTPRPDANITINSIAGDMAQLYGANCAGGIGGTVQLTFSGPVSYSGIAANALTPASVNGNVVTWNVVDFGAVDNYHAFNVMLHVSTSAQAGEQVCVTVTVTPSSGTDYRPGNNTINYCFHIVASLDPNEKEVYPFDTITNNDKWLTYTIRFQNTGTASAQHIYVDDTLDAHFDLSSFQLLAASHQNLTQVLPGGVVRFNFPNINLPDSLHNEPQSHGYVQYKVKLKDNLPPGTQIKNTAYIYFDFNTPVVTNTTVNILGCPVIATILDGYICAGTQYSFNNQQLNVSGTYYDTLTSVNGCDSVIMLNLFVDTVNATYTTTPVYCPEGINGTAQITGVNGSAIYAIDSGAYSGNNTFTNLTSGYHMVYIIKTFDECTDTISVFVPQQNLNNVVAHVSDTNVCLGQKINLTSSIISQPGCGITNVSVSTNAESGVIGLGSTLQTGNLGTPPTLVGNAMKSNRSQILYTAAELNNALQGKNVIGGLAFHFPILNSSGLITNYGVKMGCTGLDSLTNWVSGLTEVWHGDYTPTVGWSWFTFTSPYYWDGTSNLIVEVCDYMSTAGSGNNKAECTLTSHTSYIHQSLQSDLCGNNGALLTKYNFRPNIKFKCGALNYSGRYLWSPFIGSNAVSQSNIANPSAIVNSDVIYAVSYTDMYGCVSTDSISVSPRIHNTPVLDSITVKPICFNDTGYICVHISGGTPPYTYLWNDATTNACNYSITAAEVHIAITDIAGCIVRADTVILRDSMHVKINGMACRSLPDSLVASVINFNGNVNLVWQFNHGSTTPNVHSPGLYSVTATDISGCQSIDSIVIKLNPRIDSLITTTACKESDTVGVCAYVSSGIQPYTYNWSNDSLTNCILAIGNQHLLVTVTDLEGCSVTSNTTVPNDYYFSALLQSTYCHGAPDSLKLTYGGGHSPYTVSWLPLNWSTAPKVNAPGTYKVLVRDAYGCTASDSVTYTDTASLRLEILAPRPGSNGAICIGSYPVIADVVPTSTGNYIWWSNAINGGIGFSHLAADVIPFGQPNFTDTGTYYYTVARSCYDMPSDTVALHIINCDTIVDTTVAINKIALGNILMYPNPAKDELNIISTGNPLTEIAVTDMQGRLVIRKQSSSTLREHLNITQLANGVYVIEITTGQGAVRTRIVKE